MVSRGVEFFWNQYNCQVNCLCCVLLLPDIYFPDIYQQHGVNNYSFTYQFNYSTNSVTLLHGLPAMSVSI